MEKKELDFESKQNRYLQDETTQITYGRWYCLEDCQCLAVPCAGEEHIDIDSENRCPFYFPNN